MEQPKRNYGHDSIIQSARGSKKSTVSPVDILRFHFDNALSKATNFIIFLIVLSALLAMVLLLLQLSFFPEQVKLEFNQWWFNFAKLLGIGAGDSWGDRLINFMFAAIGVSISAAVIGFISKGISNVTEKLKKGRSKVIVENHILILGWSNNIYALISELIKANSNIKNASIVILSPHENQKMRDLLSTNLDREQSGRVITRNGDITNPKDIEIANPTGAKSIIILGGTSKKDLEVKLSLLAVYSFVTGTNKPIIAQISDKGSLNTLKKIRNINLIPVYDYDVLVKVCSQSIRQQGIGRVVLDFMDFDGNEVYYAAEPRLEGKTYLEAVMSFSEACVIGVYATDGKVHLNPDKSFIIGEGDKMIVVAEDDDRITYSPMAGTHQPPLEGNQQHHQAASNILIIGWSPFALDVLQQYLPFKHQHQKVYIAFDTDCVDDPSQLKTTIAADQRIESAHPLDADLSLADLIKSKNIDTVLILPYTERLGPEEADTLTILKMIELNSGNNADGAGRVRVIAYLLDSSKSEIASFTETEELIISDNLSSLLIAQYSENPHLLPLFKDIFDADGASINLIKASELVETTNELHFSDIVYQGILKGVSVLGVQSESGKNETVRLNIPKSEKVRLSNNDNIIVISA